MERSPEMTPVRTDLLRYRPMSGIGERIAAGAIITADLAALVSGGYDLFVDQNIGNAALKDVFLVALFAAQRTAGLYKKAWQDIVGVRVTLRPFSTSVTEVPLADALERSP